MYLFLLLFCKYAIIFICEEVCASEEYLLVVHYLIGSLFNWHLLNLNHRICQAFVIIISNLFIFMHFFISFFVVIFIIITLLSFSFLLCIIFFFVSTSTSLIIHHCWIIFLLITYIYFIFVNFQRLATYYLYFYYYVIVFNQFVYFHDQLYDCQFDY